MSSRAPIIEADAHASGTRKDKQGIPVVCTQEFRHPHYAEPGDIAASHRSETPPATDITPALQPCDGYLRDRSLGTPEVKVCWYSTGITPILFKRYV